MTDNLCECGCGTAIPPRTKAGNPQRFMHGHNRSWRMGLARTPAESFFRHVEFGVHPAGCWTWTGFTNSRGYGQFKVTEQGKTSSVRAHRFAYELLMGQIPPGLVIDHLCRSRDCVNPLHIEPVTQFENTLRGNNFMADPEHRGNFGRDRIRMTHCKNGHPLNESTTDAGRRCSICRRAAQRRRYHRARAGSGHV
jgi:hypothetical protein